MSPENTEVRRWLIKAGNDWSAVRKLIVPVCAEPDVAAFHCQQAVEKTLKAYLVSRTIDFQKIHDLGRLLDQCCAVDQDFETLRDDVEPLTLYAVAFRYPGPAEPAAADVDSALEVVERVWNFVTARLDDDVVP